MSLIDKQILMCIDKIWNLYQEILRLKKLEREVDDSRKWNDAVHIKRSKEMSHE